jgi:hypothetical protein
VVRVRKIKKEEGIKRRALSIFHKFYGPKALNLI